MSNCNNRKYTERLNQGCLSTTIAHSHGSIYHTIYHIQVQSCALPAALILVRVFVPVSRHGPALNLRADYYLERQCTGLTAVVRQSQLVFGQHQLPNALSLYVLFCDD